MQLPSNPSTTPAVSPRTPTALKLTESMFATAALLAALSTTACDGRYTGGEITDKNSSGGHRPDTSSTPGPCAKLGGDNTTLQIRASNEVPYYFISPEKDESGTASHWKLTEGDKSGQGVILGMATKGEQIWADNGGGISTYAIDPIALQTLARIATDNHELDLKQDLVNGAYWAAVALGCVKYGCEDPFDGTLLKSDFSYLPNGQTSNYPSYAVAHVGPCQESEQ